jgi:hypothetical protein
MNSENTKTYLGKWSVGLALISIIISLLLLWLFISMWFGHSSEGEGGLAATAIIGIIISCGSIFITIISLTGLGFAIVAIYKTSRRQGLTGLLLNIAMLIIIIVFWLWILLCLPSQEIKP